MKPPKLKLKKCKVCKCQFMQERHGQVICTLECVIADLKAKEAKRDAAKKAETRAAKKEFNTTTTKMRKQLNENDIKWHKKRTRRICHLYIRTRDAKEPCFTCGTTADVLYAAGHFVPDGRAAALRYDERNIHKQCNMNCNKSLSGNLGSYRAKLVQLHGEEYVQELERIGHTKKSWTIPELIEVHDYYKAKLKAITETYRKMMK